MPIKTFLNVPGHQNVSEHQGAFSSMNLWQKDAELIKTTRKNVVLFSHLDLTGRSGERNVFVIFLLLASSDARLFLSHGDAARVNPLHLQKSS